MSTNDQDSVLQKQQPKNDEEDDDDDIPIIDLSLEEPKIVADLWTAFTTIGFATLVHHGVSSTLIDQAFQASQSFFALPGNVKQQYAFQSHTSNRGYIGQGMEKHDTTGCLVPVPDAKETFDIGKDDEPGFTNPWPQELDPSSFRDVLRQYFQTMDQLHLNLMRYIALALKLPDPDRLVTQCNGQHCNLRLLHYPALTEPCVRGHVHSDFGTLTLLVQDAVGGLQVQRVDGSWMSVTPRPYAIVVNVGDMLMRWTNDTVRATPHQVIPTPQIDSSERMNIPERYSIAFFCNANKDTELVCLRSCCSPQRPARYPPINAHDYLTKRLTDTIQK